MMVDKLEGTAARPEGRGEWNDRAEGLSSRDRTHHGRKQV